MAYYINMKTGKDIETIDSADTYKEAKFLLSEYRIANHSGVYISSRATKEHRESNKRNTKNA